MIITFLEFACNGTALIQQYYNDMYEISKEKLLCQISIERAAFL
jgi:hypothetical protein